MMLYITPRRIVLAGITLSVFGVLPAKTQVIGLDQKLIACDGTTNDNFGVSVAISGSTAIVGALLDDDVGSGSGSAYLIDIITGKQLFKLTASDAAGGDQFGGSVAISGTTAIVGAWRDDDAGSTSGSAYIFDTTTGQQLFKLVAPDAAAGDEFGVSVAISGTTAIIGARLDDDAGYNSGSAYLFDTTTGQQLFKLTASDAAGADEFGGSVAIFGTTAIVGATRDDDTGSASGSAYIFDTTTGQQLYKLTASDAEGGEQFGWSVAISETAAIVGAIFDAEETGSGSGSAYIFDTTTGQQLYKLTASDSSEGSAFGIAVAISGSNAIVGAYGNNNTGLAYHFDATTGQQLFKLAASDAAPDDRFGSSIASSGTITLVGSYLDDEVGGINSGSVYIFEAHPKILQQPQGVIVNEGETISFEVIHAYTNNMSYQWRRDGIELTDGDNITGADTATLQIIVSQSDLAMYDCVAMNTFGSITSNAVVLGVRPDPDACPADLNGDDMLDFLDISAFLQSYGDGCP